MNLHEKSKAYAEGKALEILSKAIEKAYEAGYHEGYRDGLEKQIKDIPIVFKDNNTEYVDLGLPSGTLWSSDYLKEDGKNVYLPYGQAIKYNIPSEVQFNELKNKCKIIRNFNGNVGYFTIIGPNGNFIDWKIDAFYKGNERVFSPKEVAFWLKEDIEDNESTQKSYVCCDQYHVKIGFCFSGYKLPLRLVCK